jgi:hypothetical protein
MDGKEVMLALQEPFEMNEIKVKPQAVKGDKALAVFYIDSRLVMDRLDDVMGVGNWQDEYTPLPDGSVMCRLSILIGGVWISKSDVGSQSEQPDGGDRMKAAFSDALKRAAVKFGIGRYLYRLPLLWAPYEPQWKRFVRPPELPAWAKPSKVIDRKQPAPYAEAEPLTEAPKPAQLPPAPPTAPTLPAAPAQPQTLNDIWNAMGQRSPADGTELRAWVCGLDKKLIGMVHDHRQGDLLESVSQFLRLPDDTAESFARIQKTDVSAGWANARQYVNACAKQPNR